MQNDHAVARIAELLNGKVWTADTLEDVAEILREAGYQIDPPDEDDDIDPANPTGCPHRTPDGESAWAYTGTAYGGDDPSYHGEGRCYCILCGADGDA